MRSQLRFVMHPDDERDFLSRLMSDGALFLVDSARSTDRRPMFHHSAENLPDTRYRIWLQSNSHETQNMLDVSAVSATKTIQFDRSQIVGSIITEGTISIATEPSDTEAAAVELQFKSLVKFLKMRCTNSVVRWYSPGISFKGAAPGRSANPSKPDPQVWVGRFALEWLRQNPDRRIRQHWSYGAYALI